MASVQDGIVIDLSEHNGTVDFELLSKVPNLKGAIIRVQAGSTHPDSKYKENVAGCKKYGIPFGTYAYFYGVSVPDAIQEATNAHDRMDQDSIEFAVDIEEQTCNNPSDLIPAGQAYVDYLKNKGLKKVGLYSGDHFFRAFGLQSIKVDFHWIASYGSNDGSPHTEPVSPDDLWQFTSVGHLAGIQGAVDESLPTGEPMSYFTGKNVITKTPPAPIQHEATSSTPVLEGWRKEGRQWFFYKKGYRQIGWLQYKDKWYYLDTTTGAMKQGWLLYKNHWYYLNPEVDRGEMMTGWVTVGKGKYYLDPTHGYMYIGIHTIDGVQHEFGASGLFIK